VEKAAVAARFLHRVADGVPEVEDPAKRGLPLVPLDDGRLERDGAADDPAPFLPGGGLPLPADREKPTP
jgi:hypothetical protein